MNKLKHVAVIADGNGRCYTYIYSGGWSGLPGMSTG